MILDYDKRPDATVDEKIRSLKDSVQLALNRIEGATLAGTIDGTKVNIVKVQGGSLVGTIDGSYVFVKNLDANSIATGDIAAERIKSAVINAINAAVGQIDADRINVSDIVASQAFIAALSAEVADLGYITADTIDAGYAKIDASNITTLVNRDAWIDNLLVQSGLLANSGTVFTLDAIQVNAANISAGTIDVERLIVTVGGQKYLVNFDAQGNPQYEKMDGNIIQDHTITADKILAHSITANEITTQNLVGTSGWINLAAGVFAYVNANENTGIVWDGTRLTINATSVTIGGDNIATAIAAAQAAAANAIKTVEYAVGDSPSTTPSTGWSTASPQWQSGKYVWMRQSKDGTNYTYTCIQGAQGPQGEQGIQGEQGPAGSSVTVSSIHYGSSASASTAPSSWSTTVPSSLAKGTWLWIKTTYSDNTEAVTKSYIGTDGEDGKSVYVQSSTKVDGTTTVVLTDGTTTTTLVIDDGADGDDGSPGAAGTNAYVHVAWANSADGQVDFSTSVSAGKKYLGVYTDNTSADSQTYTDYSWSLIQGPQGVQGEQGPQGETGQNGQDGQDGTNGDDGTSVSSVTPFYKLDTAAPTKPADDVMTPAGWSTSEPQYDSEYNCYVSFRTVYDDGSCKWSAVSMSSSYEAAKQANDTVTALQGEVDEVNRTLEEDIGGAIGSLQSDMTDVSGTISGLSSDIDSLGGRTTAAENTLNNILPDIENMRGMVAIHPEVPEIIIAAGPNKVRITNTEIQFLVGSDNRKVAYLSGSKLFITESEVTDLQRIGPFLWAKQSDSRISLRYSPESQGV